jgi:CheY-like chemotaxis protein
MSRIALNVLFVDDSDIDVELTLRALKQQGYDAAWDRVDQEADMRRMLTDRPPQVIISDFSMPCFDGTMALRVAREMVPDIPFVFLSGTIGEERAAEAMRLGATAYVEKGDTARLDEVLRRIATQS